MVVLPVFTGCTLLNRTEFYLLSQSVNDDKGFPSYALGFNTTGTITVKISGPQGLLYEKVFYKGVHNAILPLNDYRHTPWGGIYTLWVFDENDNIVFENQMTFSEPSLSVDTMELLWWDNSDSYSLVGIQISVINIGDLPIYPYEIRVKVGSAEISGRALPVVLLPNETGSIDAALYLSEVSPVSHATEVSITSVTGSVLASYIEVVNPEENVDEQVFSWRYKGSQVLRLPELPFLYDYYRSLQRFLSEDYAAYVFDGYDESYIELITAELQERMISLDLVESVNFIASFVQDIQYATDDNIDPTCAEYPRFPLETIVDGQGDCEDKAILAASILDLIDIEVTLLRLPNHMAIGVHLSENATDFEYYVDEYYFLETTRNRWVVGKVPDEYVGLSNASAYSISKRPILLHSWDDATRYTTSDGSDYVAMKIIVENIGSGTAQNFEVQGAFYSVDNQSRNPRSVVVYGLEPGMKEMVHLEMDVPTGITTILRTELGVDGVVVHDKESTSTFP